MSGAAGGSGVTVEAWRDGAAFRVKAHAGARREGVSGCHDGALKVDVNAAPERGKANKGIVRILAKALAVPPSTVELLSGETQPLKRFGVAGIEPGELRRRIALALERG